jgi:hypothetical protein
MYPKASTVPNSCQKCPITANIANDLPQGNGQVAKKSQKGMNCIQGAHDSDQHGSNKNMRFAVVRKVHYEHLVSDRELP